MFTCPNFQLLNWGLLKWGTRHFFPCSPFMHSRAMAVSCYPCGESGFLIKICQTNSKAAFPISCLIRLMVTFHHVYKLYHLVLLLYGMIDDSLKFPINIWCSLMATLNKSHFVRSGFIKGNLAGYAGKMNTGHYWRAERDSWMIPELAPDFRNIFHSAKWPVVSLN